LKIGQITTNALRLNIFETNDNTNDIRYNNDAILDSKDNEHYDNNDQNFAYCNQDVWIQNDEQYTLCLHHPTV